VETSFRIVLIQAGDEEVARALVRLFTETGEQCLHLLLTQQPEWLVSLAACLLRGAAHPDADVAEITFNFWYMLAEELNGGGRSLNDAQRVDARGLFADCFRQLLQVPPRRAGGTMEPALSLL